MTEIMNIKIDVRKLHDDPVVCTLLLIYKRQNLIA